MQYKVREICGSEKFCMLFCRLLILFSKSTFLKKNLSGTPSECQAVWIPIRPDVLSGLIFVQSVCKGDEQTTRVGDASVLFCSVPIRPRAWLTGIGLTLT